MVVSELTVEPANGDWVIFKEASQLSLDVNKEL